MDKLKQQIGAYFNSIQMCGIDCTVLVNLEKCLNHPFETSQLEVL